MVLDGRYHLSCVLPCPWQRKPSLLTTHPHLRFHSMFIPMSFCPKKNLLGWCISSSPNIIEHPPPPPPRRPPSFPPTCERSSMISASSKLIILTNSCGLASEADLFTLNELANRCKSWIHWASCRWEGWTSSSLDLSCCSICCKCNKQLSWTLRASDWRLEPACSGPTSAIDNILQVYSAKIHFHQARLTLSLFCTFSHGVFGPLLLQNSADSWLTIFATYEPTAPVFLSPLLHSWRQRKRKRLNKHDWPLLEGTDPKVV